MTVFITDTHAIIWHLVAPAKLAGSADQAFNQADDGQAEVHIPAVVLAEMAMVAEKGRVPGWGLSQVQLFVQATRASGSYRLSGLTPDLVMASTSLASIPDIFDRLIAAEAMAKGATLIPRDHVFSDVIGLHTVSA